jgi:hypothetical protein
VKAVTKPLLAFAVVLTAGAAAGCDARSLDVKTTGAGGGGGSIGIGGGAVDSGTYVPTRKVDMLFVIDDSSEMRLSQNTFISNFPVFMQRLMDPPGPPDLHIAVISTDMGAGDGSIAGCDATGGQNGIFQYTPRGTCSTSGLAPGATFIADDGTNRNYTGNISDVFSCIAALGESGCGFEHQLAAITRALGADGRPAPLENQGFLRTDAFLVIVLLTNEDDCSAAAGSNLYDTTHNMNLASMLGPPANFRCNEFGHLCNGMKPPRLAPTGSVTDTVTLDGCVSAESAGMLIPVADVATAIRSVKPFPDQQIVVTAIAGLPTPYTVKWHSAPLSDTGLWPVMSHSCTGSDGTFADPAVRINQWVQAFGDNGVLLPICNNNYGPALDRLAALLNQGTTN